MYDDCDGCMMSVIGVLWVVLYVCVGCNRCIDGCSALMYDGCSRYVIAVVFVVVVVHVVGE